MQTLGLSDGTHAEFATEAPLHAHPLNLVDKLIATGYICDVVGIVFETGCLHSQLLSSHVHASDKCKLAVW